VKSLQSSGTGFIYRMADWMMKLAFVNLLWILFTILGLVVFGFYPAWIAMCRLMTLWSRGEDPPLFKTYWSIYRKVFMDEGVIMEEGPPEEIFDNPQHTRTQEFLSKIL